MKRSPAALAFCFLMAGGTALADPSPALLDGRRFDGAAAQGAVSGAAPLGHAVESDAAETAARAA